MLGCLLLGGVTAGSAGPARAPEVRPPAVVAAAPAVHLRVLQMNLCGSGLARCFTGRSVVRAAAVIRAEHPDLVTVNEVCRDDVPVLERALADGAGRTRSAFRAAVDRRTGTAFRCRNGQPYGIGLAARLPAAAGGAAGEGGATVDGVYPMQDPRQREERVWLCLDAGAALTACTTHLANADAAVAGRQCRYLLGTAIPAAYPGVGASVVVGADLNLRPGGSPDVRSCVPAGHGRADDDGVQNVVTTPGLAVVGRRSVDMAGTTDHPGLLVDLRSTGAGPPAAPAPR